MRRNLWLRKVLIVVLSVLCVNGLMLVVDAAEYPLAELYFYNHGEIPTNSDPLGALDTTQFKTMTTAEIISAGYTCYSYINIPAGTSNGSASVIRTLANDAIFFIYAHGGAGRVVCVDGANHITRLTANATSNNDNYSLAYNFGNTTSKLKSMKLAYWMGCNTYGNHSTYGSLNGKCTELGVDCVITHNNTIWTPYAGYFLYRFAYYLDQGYTVETALSSAKSSTLAYYNIGNDTTSVVYQTVSSYKINGANTNPGNVRIEPASYGVS